MIYLFAGDDTKKKLQFYQKFLATLPKDLELIFISKNNFSKIEVESFYSGATLFFSKCVVVLDSLLEKEDSREFLLSKIDFLNDAQNEFVFLDGKLAKPIVDIFKKLNIEEKRINVFDQAKHAEEKYNNFILANDFGAKDKFNLWLHYREAVDLGVSLEELVGVLFWKVKDMILKKNFSKWKLEELQNIGSKLSYLLPQTRRDGKDAEITFERFLLEIF